MKSERDFDRNPHRHRLFIFCCRGEFPVTQQGFCGLVVKTQTERLGHLYTINAAVDADENEKDCRPFKAALSGFVSIGWVRLLDRLGREYSICSTGPWDEL